MKVERKRELYRLVEACRETDTTELELEKTAAIEELLGEVKELEACQIGWVERNGAGIG